MRNTIIKSFLSLVIYLGVLKFVNIFYTYKGPFEAVTSQDTSEIDFMKKNISIVVGDVTLLGLLTWYRCIGATNNLSHYNLQNFTA